MHVEIGQFLEGFVEHGEFVRGERETASGQKHNDRRIRAATAERQPYITPA